MSRRSFVALGLGSTAAALSPSAAAAPRARAAGASGSAAKPQLGRRKLGSLEVSELGMGCMSMTSYYNPPRDKQEMIGVIRGAVDRGVTFFDTAEVYGPFSNEEIVGEALAPVRNQVLVVTKIGFSFAEGDRAGRDSRPASLRRAVDGSLKRLRAETIDLLYQHRVDPKVPIEDVAGTFKELIQAGKIRHYGLSEAAPATIRRAHAVHPVTALQSQYSLIERVHENGTLATCEELGIGFVPWGPLGRGFLNDRYNEWSRFAEESRHASVEQFAPEALKANMALLDLVRAWAVRKGATPGQLALAWLLAEKPWIVPIPGTTRLHHLEENLGAASVHFTPDELKEFRGAFAKIEVKGARAPESVSTDL